MTRNSRDFDSLAAALAADMRVIAVDVAGRGRSSWLADSCRYAAPTCIGQSTALLANLGLEQVDLVGTSMGGIIGMGLATLPPAPGAPPLVRRLVLNDIGGMGRRLRASRSSPAISVRRPSGLPISPRSRRISASSMRASVR